MKHVDSIEGDSRPNSAKAGAGGGGGGGLLDVLADRLRVMDVSSDEEDEDEDEDEWDEE